LGGILVAAILAIWRNGLANLWASLVGLVVGTIILVIVNYLIWRGLFLGVYAHDSFVDFIFPRGTDWVYFIINQNPFFIPSIIAVLLSTFGARQINKHVLLEQSTG